MKRFLPLIIMLIAMLVVQIKPVDGASGYLISNLTKSAKTLENVGLSIVHSSSDIGTKFEFVYRRPKSKRKIVWHPVLVTFPAIKEGSDGGLIGESLKDSEGRKYSFTIANGRLKGSSFLLQDYTDGVQANFIEFDLEAIVRNAKSNSKIPNK